jgi:hypothetical protein
MLALETCRKILGEDAPADERQLEKARDDAYRLARLLLDIYRAEKAKKYEAELAEDPEI